MSIIVRIRERMRRVRAENDDDLAELEQRVQAVESVVDTYRRLMADKKKNAPRRNEL